MRGGSGHNIGYWDAIINVLLAELDGANQREGIFVVAATNNPSNVDEALLRSGRLERQVEIPKPDAASIAGLLRHHGVPDGGDMAEAARAGEGRRRRSLCCATRPGGSRGLWVDADACATCSTQFVSVTREFVRTSMTSLLAARRADAMLGAGASSGAVGDLMKATAMARAAVAQWEFGGAIRCHTDDEATRSKAVRDQVDELLEDADLAAAKLVDRRPDAIRAVAEALRERPYLDAAEVEAVMEVCRKNGAIF